MQKKETQNSQDILGVQNFRLKIPQYSSDQTQCFSLDPLHM